MEALPWSRSAPAAEVAAVLVDQRSADAGDDWDVPVEAAYAAFERALSRTSTAPADAQA